MLPHASFIQLIWRSQRSIDNGVLYPDLISYFSDWRSHREDQRRRSTRHFPPTESSQLLPNTIQTLPNIPHSHPQSFCSSPSLTPSILHSANPQILRKSARIPRLHEYRPGARELTNQSLARADTGNDTPRRHTLEYVFAVPGYEMAVVYDVFFAFDKL